MSERRHRPAPAAPDEVTLYELGESLAMSVGRVESELGRQRTDGFGHRLDELEVSLPVSLRLDDLGQPLVRAQGQPAGGASLTFRFKPRGDNEPAMHSPPNHPLAALKALGPRAEATLRARRIHSVQDLVRVAQTPAGRAALTALRLGVPLNRLLDRADVLALPLPPKVAAALLSSGVASAGGFHRIGVARLASRLSKALGRNVTPTQVTTWKREALGPVRGQSQHEVLPSVRLQSTDTDDLKDSQGNDA